MDHEYIKQIYIILQRLIGHHRLLKELINSERESLISLDVQAIQDATYRKEVLIEEVRKDEEERGRLTRLLASDLGIDPSELTLSKLIIRIQGNDLQQAEKFRSALNALTLLIQRVHDQNRENRMLLDKAMEHVGTMKTNILGAETAGSQTYTNRGQKQAGQTKSRLFNREI